MINLKEISNLINNMGWKYVIFRIKYELQLKTGTLKNKFPTSVKAKTKGSLQYWKKHAGNFFFEGKKNITVTKDLNPNLKISFENIKKGKLHFFNSIDFEIGTNYDWLTNPDTGYKYDINKHWTEIEDYSKEAGDIKYVWEKSRFSFIYDLIRYDYHFEEDCSNLVFKEILSWIEHNPINCGPNYRCSQEISLRVLNWTFALFYYKNSSNLTEESFYKIEQSIYWQIHHVYQNINFSRIAVRNNHAITESLTLYLCSILFPYISDFKIWGREGKKWFEEEIEYQIYEDGTFLQFSMNYHRVLIQLLTWGIRLAHLNGDKFHSLVYDRATKSLEFLRTCMDDISGQLPNYGANDGALFFKLNNDSFRDYRSQLKALAVLLNKNLNIKDNDEDLNWYCLMSNKIQTPIDLSKSIYSFPIGGYYIIRESRLLTFIRCGNHKDRPSQADNLHMDVWYNGDNILLDGGSYKYNSTIDDLTYFFGTSSHNSVMIDNFDQMKKGGRFTWYYWSQCNFANLKEENNIITFEGRIKAFTYLNKKIQHSRKISKIKDKKEWVVSDEIFMLPNKSVIRQIWNQPLEESAISIKAEDLKGNINPEIKDGWYSSLYGKKERIKQLIFSSSNNIINTKITLKDLT